MELLGDQSDPSNLSNPKRLRTILHEQCAEYGPAVQATDFNQRQCITTDGILLAQDTISWGSWTNLEAREVARRKLTIAVVIPPLRPCAHLCGWSDRGMVLPPFVPLAFPTAIRNRSCIERSEARY